MDRLCEHCKNIFRGSSPDDFQDYIHHYSEQELEQAAFEKCYICCMLWKKISDEAPRDRGVDLFETADHENVNLAFSELSFLYHDPVFGNPLYDLRFALRGVRKGDLHLVLEVTGDVQDLLEKSNVTRSVAWDGGMHVATSWLTTCQRDHEKCNAPTSPETYVPKRILSIGHPYPEKVYLVIDPGLKLGQIRYATVSHCWGSSKTMTLDARSLATLEAGIEIAKLPQNFQDAIYTTKCLGIQFLWIDSLCIFQDAKDDWDAQAPLMSHIYLNGVINIAMSAAASSSESCFFKRDLSQMTPFILQTEWGNCPNYRLHVYNENIREELLNSKPLSKRAWVVQELFLPPRILHLTGNQIFWECFEFAACEVYPYGLPKPNIPPFVINENPRNTAWKALNSAKRGIQEKNEDSKDPQAEIELKHLWRDTVSIYTSRDLTVESDRLVALAGIAKIMSQALDDEYCAGLWLKTMARDLCWWVTGRIELVSRPDVYCAPSWSWASLVRQEVHFPKTRRTNPEIQTIDCRVDTTTGDPFGFVRAGILTLCGRLATMRLHVKGMPDGNRILTHQGPIGYSVFLNGSWYDTSWESVMILPDFLFSYTQLHCLLVFSGAEWDDMATFLLLVPTGNQKGQFQRVGLAEIDQMHKRMSASQIFENPQNEDWLEYEERYQDGQYRISIV